MNNNRRPRFTPLTITIAYLILAFLWVILSDQVLEAFIGDLSVLSRLQTYKGVLFVLITAFMLFVMLRSYQAFLRGQLEQVKREREDLAKREVLYRVLTETQQSIIVRLAPDLRLLYANPALAKLLGQPKDFWMGRSLSDIPMPADLRDIWQSIARQVLTSGQHWRDQMIFRQDGEARHFDCLAICETGADARISAITFTAHDVTDLVKARQALERSEATMRSLFDAAPLGIGLINAKRTLGLTNRKMSQMLGYGPDYLKGQNARVLYGSQAEYERVGRIQQHEMRLRGAVSIETRWRKKTGEEIDILLNLAAINPENLEDGLVCTAMDLSDMVQAKKERELLVTALEQVAECIIMTDIAGRTIYVNSAYEKLSGYNKIEMMGRTPAIFSGDAHDLAQHNQIRKALKKGEFWQGTLKLSSKNGPVYETETVISPIKDENGEVTNFVAVQRDVSNERNLESQLQQARKMEAIGTLAGGIAHDFNNILGAICGYTELALTIVPDENKAHEYLLQVQQGGDRARRLVKQILTFSRQTPQEKKPLSLAVPVKEALSLLRASLPSTIDITQDIEDNLPTVMADSTQIHQVLMNLCTNAAYSMAQEGGKLQVSLKAARLGPGQGVPLKDAEGEYVCLSVRDTGHGMSPQVLQRIFDPFFTTKKPGEGTGMGLAMVHGIVKSHGGEVVAQSQVGQGSEFQVYLPAAQEESYEPGLHTSPVPRGSGESLLFVDDEQSLVELSVQMLSNLGYKVDACLSGVEALQRFKAEPGKYDVVITDLTMPKLTGLELTRELLALRPDLPVILCTGFSETGVRSQAEKAGVRSLIMKPLTQRNLAEEIRESLQSRPGDRLRVS